MNQLSYQAQPSCCNIVNYPIWNVCVCDSLPAHSIRDLVPSLPALGRSGCFCVIFDDHVIFSDTMWQRKIIWSVLHCFLQIHETGIWGGISVMFCWVSLRGLVGCRIRPWCCASKDCGSGHGVAAAALSHCAMPFCSSAPLFHLPCPSSVQAAQGRDCHV